MKTTNPSKSKSLGEEFIEPVREAGAVQRGEIPPSSEPIPKPREALKCRVKK